MDLQTQNHAFFYTIYTYYNYYYTSIMQYFIVRSERKQTVAKIRLPFFKYKK